MSDQAVFSSTEAHVLHKALKKTCDNCAELITLVMATSDGHVVAAETASSSLDSHRLAAMAASFTGLSYTMASETNMGNVKRASIEGANGLLLSQLIEMKNMDFVVTAIFDKDIKTGLAQYALKSLVADLLKCLN